MRIALKPRHFIFACTVVAVTTLVPLAAWLGYISLSLPPVDFLADPAVSFRISVLDWEGNSRPFTVGPANPHWTPLDGAPQSLRSAVVVAEDFNFYHHRGVDWFEVWEAVKRDVRERRFARGASTISQQLAKNLFLTRDRTLSRKARELFLTRRLERTLSKDRILELYLNVVELGPLVYGVGHAAEHYFGRPLADITLRESTFLAAMLPGPRVLDPRRAMDRVMERSDRILATLARAEKITEDQYRSALLELPVPRGMDRDELLKMVPERVAVAPPVLEPEVTWTTEPIMPRHPGPDPIRGELGPTKSSPSSHGWRDLLPPPPLEKDPRLPSGR